MRTIDMQTWSRREHFNVYRTFDHPHFSMCANVDLTSFYPFIKQRGISFTVAFVFALTRSANAIPEFRYRIRAGEVVEHETVHPSFTVLSKEDLFSFCALQYVNDFFVFAEKAAEQIAKVKKVPILKDEAGEDNLLFMTAIPWVSFTSFMHPLHLSPVDSIPRFAWGKFFEEGGSLKMPLSVQGHHALMDGIHMGHFYAKVQGCLHQPAGVFGGVK